MLCDKRITFLQKIRDSEYCSKDHRNQERERMTLLAIERLAEAAAAEHYKRERAADTAPDSTNEQAVAMNVSEVAEA